MKKLILLSLLSFVSAADAISNYIISQANGFSTVLNGCNDLVTEGIQRAKYYQSNKTSFGGSANASVSILKLDSNGKSMHPFLQSAVIGCTGSTSITWRGISGLKNIYYLKIQFYGTPLLGIASTPADPTNSPNAQLSAIPKSLHGKYIVFAIIASAANAIDVSSNEYELFSTNANNSFDPGSAAVSTPQSLVKPMFSLSGGNIPEIFTQAYYIKYGGVFGITNLTSTDLI